jgi:hypothetical protein
VAALTSTADRASSELADALSAFVAELAALRARIDAVEHRLSPSTLRREDRAALERILPAIAGALGSDLFLSIEAVTSDNPALVLVLGAMDARRLGKLLLGVPTCPSTATSSTRKGWKRARYRGRCCASREKQGLSGLSKQG